MGLCPLHPWGMSRTNDSRCLRPGPPRDFNGCLLFPRVSESSYAAEVVVRIHLIWMAGPRRDPKVRVLLVEASGAQAVYERVDSWFACSQWLDQVLGAGALDDELAVAKEAFLRDQYATVKDVRVLAHTLESGAFHRVDK